MEELMESPVVEKRRGNPNFGKRNKEVKDPTDRDFGIVIDATKPYVFEVLRKSEAHRTQSLSGICQIFDPVEQRIRTIRYIPKASSIFEDEQDEAYTDADAQTLYFTRDQLFIDGKDKRGVEYCILHDQYDGIKPENRISKKGAFFTLVDKLKYEKEIDAKLDKETKALDMIAKASIDKLLPMARIVFNITDEDELIVRNRLREYAKKPVKAFEKSGAMQVMENLDSPALNRRYIIQKALDKGIIKVDNIKSLVVWGDSNNPITEINPQKSTTFQVSDLATFSFTKQGEEFYQLVKNSLLPA